MDRKIIGIGIGVMLVISIIAVMGFAFAQEPQTTTSKDLVDADNNGICDNAKSGNCPYANQAGDFVDTDNDGACDNAGNCPMHNPNGGCASGCAKHSAGSTGGCHRTATLIE